jgi:hypothetical protein
MDNTHLQLTHAHLSGHCLQTKGVFFFSFLSSRSTGDHPEEGWAKFGYRSDSKVEIFRILLCFGDLHKFIFSIWRFLTFFLQIWQFFPKRTLCTFHRGNFAHIVTTVQNFTKKKHCSQTCGANQLKKAWFMYLLCSANSARCSWSSSGISLNSSENWLHQIAQDDEDRQSRIYKWHETSEKHTHNNIIKGNKNSIQDAANKCTVLQCCYRENKQH